MGLPALQKYLGWLQRFLYQVESGDVPFPQPVIDIGQDWPLDQRQQTQDYNTIAGTATTQILLMSPEQHALVFMCQTLSLGAPFPATDALSLNLEDTPGGLAPAIVSHWIGQASTNLLLYGGTQTTAAFARSGQGAFYMPPASRMILAHTSVAGGIAASLRTVFIVRPRFLPLRLP